jgi:hypothetical protein
VSAPVPPAGTQAQWPPPAGAREWCPLCGCPLHSSQDWCLRCGAAARTRLAATPRWKAPLLALATAVVLSLGVLVASLVKLIG